jgi:3-phenylpropionate/trans-cinnamate dioxygenase ferredoxin reductase subunit
MASGIEHVVVIGAGQAGAQAAYSLRQSGFEGALTLLGDEAYPPYQRPPLSKGYLKGELEADRLFLKPGSYYSDNRIDLVTSAAPVRLDLAARRVEFQAGPALGWDRLVIATGARPRMLTLPGAGLDGVLALRTLADVDQLRPYLTTGARLIVIGGGYIGLEAAAAACRLGVSVTLLEAAPQLLGRVTGPEIADFFLRTHRAAGVDVRLNAVIEGFEGTGRVSTVRLAGGERLACDVVLVGIGVIPNLELAQQAGLVCGAGLIVDRAGRTSHPDVFAAGDLVQRPLVHYGRVGRLESVHNAIEGGKIVAASILGLPPPTEEAPWFWSDQFDVKLQTAGLWTGADQRVVRGDPESGRFAVFYLKEGRILAVDAVNAGPEFLVGKRLAALSARLAPSELADVNLSMKEIGARALG